MKSALHTQMKLQASQTSTLLSQKAPSQMGGGRENRAFDASSSAGPQKGDGPLRRTMKNHTQVCADTTNTPTRLPRNLSGSAAPPNIHNPQPAQ